MVQRFRALGFAFTVACREPDLAGALERLLSPLARPDANGTNGYVVRPDGPDAARPFSLWFNGERVYGDASEDAVLAYLMWHVNQQAVAASSQWFLLHAAAAACGNRAFVFPAPSGSGKTTLVAGLTGRGFSYVTDDLVAVDMATGLVEPYWKPLSVKQGSWEALADLRRQPADTAATPTAAAAAEWTLSPADIGSGDLAPPCPVAFVVFPRYEEGATTALEPKSPALALLAISECSFNFAEHGRSAFDFAGRLVERAGCYDLVIGDLQAACDLVADLAGRP